MNNKDKEALKESLVRLISLKLHIALFLNVLVWARKYYFESEIMLRSLKFDRGSLFELEIE